MTQRLGHRKCLSSQWIHSSSLISHTQTHTLKYVHTHIQTLPWCVCQLQRCAVIAKLCRWWRVAPPLGNLHSPRCGPTAWLDNRECREHEQLEQDIFSYFLCMSVWIFRKYVMWLLLFVYFFYIINALFGSSLSKTIYCRIYRIIYVLCGYVQKDEVQHKIIQRWCTFELVSEKCSIVNGYTLINTQTLTKMYYTEQLHSYTCKWQQTKQQQQQKHQGTTTKVVHRWVAASDKIRHHHKIIDISERIP